MTRPITMPTGQGHPEIGAPTSGWGTIIQIDAASRSQAIDRLVNSDPDGDPRSTKKFEAFAGENQIDLRAMWSRLDDRGRLAATVLAVPNEGRTAMVFATRIRQAADVTPIAELIDHACSALQGSRPGLGEKVDLAQVLLDPADLLDQQAALQGGFKPLAKLSYLERPFPGRRVESPGWDDDASVATYQETDREELLAILESTYQDTLDCPGLRGLRRTEDILTGHMATGEYDPSLWTLLRIGDRPAGALLFNRSSRGSSIELVYLGLAPFARGRGLGQRLLQHGIAHLPRQRERVIMLAVDENNEPALRLYKSVGFRRVLRRIAMIRPTT